MRRTSVASPSTQTNSVLLNVVINSFMHEVYIHIVHNRPSAPPILSKAKQFLTCSILLFVFKAI